MANQVGPENVVGRDRLIARIWRKLEDGSLLFTAERRIGKTTVMKKMEAEPQPGFSPVYIDLEAVDSPEAFVETLLAKIRPLLSTQQKTGNFFESLLGTLGGLEVGGIVKLPNIEKSGWRGTLDKVLEGVCRHQAASRVLLLLDELPYMLQNIAVAERKAGSSSNSALGILDSLRLAREEHPNLRMVFTGSVGLHHVIDELRGAELSSQPVNNMPLTEIGPLAPEDAAALAKQLLEAEDVLVAPDDLQQLADRLAQLTDWVPFYLERVVSRLGDSDERATIASAELVVRQHLTDDRDHWEMEHFRTRIDIYYAGHCADANGKPISNAEIARTVLDTLALATEPQTIDAVWAALKAKHALEDRGHIVKMLRFLTLDHYLASDTDKKYAFRFPLIQAWWRIAQGLSQ